MIRPDSRDFSRLFLADIGGQIRLNLLVSARMKDRDLVPFLQTLDVAALNDSVFDRRPGLGQVPMIVLASALGKEARAAFEADVAARAAARPTAWAPPTCRWGCAARATRAARATPG